MTNLFYKNRGSKTVRDHDITEYLFKQVSEAIAVVFGPDYVGHIYSGGQDRRGKGARRVGTVRHDDYGSGGRAADVYVYDYEMNRLTDSALAPMVQYWLAKKIGGVGIEMGRGGIHLDEWAQPPSAKAGMFWYYKGTDRKAFTEAVIAGRKGIMPTLYKKPRKGGFTTLISAIAAVFRRKT